jgi:hypothetical protein
VPDGVVILIGAVLDGETYSYFLRYNLVLANLISPDCINAVDNLFSHHLEENFTPNAPILDRDEQDESML